MSQPNNAYIKALKQQLSKVFMGDPAVVDHLLVALLCGGHVLIEDVPGLGKTTLAKGLAKSVALGFKRVQCTPDLMPSDVLGGNIYQPNTQDFKFLPGPIFTNMLLVDEINRAPPRTQSAFLEAMAEGTVTIERKTPALTQPFMLIPTQNPVEFAGTFPLPEAQLDRFFMRLHLGYPSAEQALAILQSHRVSQPVDSLRTIITKEQLEQWQQACQAIALNSDVQKYVVAIVEATRNHKDVRLGASPRAAIALMHAARAHAYMAGQSFVTPEHVQQIAAAIISHRLMLRGSPSAGRAQKIMEEILLNVAVPAVAKEKNASE